MQIDKAERSKDRGSLPEQISVKIIQYISRQGFGPGDKLPNEYDLSELLGVSRNTVREAIRSLASRNILEIRRGAGTFISSKQGVADDPLGFSFVKDKKKLALDLMQIRFILEPEIAALAAQNADVADLEKLERICQELEALIRDGENYVQKDIQLHEQIARCSKNIVIPTLIPVIHDALSLFARITDIREGDKTMRTHRKIVSAIQDGRSCDAKNAMTAHLMYNYDRILQVVQSDIDL